MPLHLQKANPEKIMTSTQITELKARIQRIEAANAFYQNAHNAKIVEAAKKELFDATGEVLVNGHFVKPANQAPVCAFIRAHSAKVVMLPNGKLLCEEQYAGEGFPDTACEFYGPYWTLIENNMRAARDWLGY